MTTRTKRISILVTLATLATLWGGAMDAVAAPSDKALQALKGQWVIVRTTAGRQHGGTFVHFDAKTLTLHVGDWNVITLQRHLVANVAKPGTPAGKKMRSLGRAQKRRRPSLRALERKHPRKDLTRRVTKAQVTFGLGVALLAMGIAGTVGSVYRLKAIKKAAWEEPSSGSCSTDIFEESPSDDCPGRTKIPGLGFGVLAVLSGIAGFTGFVLTLQGVSRWIEYARALKKLRPQVNIDPVNKRYSVSMALSF